MIQVTVARITGYGPWTLTLGSDREHRLQMLQASLYGRLQEEFSGLGAMVFANRHDELFAVTNGIGAGEHARIAKAAEPGGGVTLDMSVGAAATPYGANLAAFEAKKGGRELLPGVYGTGAGEGDGAVIFHMDVEDLTSSTRSSSPYDIAERIAALHSEMSSFFVGHESLAFFLGGDNFMIVSHAGAVGAAEEFVRRAGEGGTAINCGIGRGRTGREAASRATASLDAIRRMRGAGGDRPQVHEEP